ncbi:MAG: AraC family transcriptional regulator [Eubacterium sp.]
MDNTLFFQSLDHYQCLESVEKTSHELYLCYCGKQECSSSHKFGPHKRTEFLLHIVLDGEGTFTTSEQTYSLKKNAIFLIYPDQITSYQADADNPWSYIWIGINGAKAESLLRHAGFRPDNPIAYLPNTAPYNAAIEGILSSCQLRFSNELRRFEYLYAFVAQLAEDLHNPDNESSPSYSQDTYVRYALDYIELNYQHNIKISDIAHSVGVSRAYLTKCFKNKMNLSPHEYLIDYRMNLAKNLLTTTKMPINQIASEVGYEDPLSFSKAFKLFTGVSPKTYREG